VIDRPHVIGHFIKESSMNERDFDVLARRTGTGISRRGSLMALGGMGLAALAVPEMAEAGKKRKKRKKARERCAQPSAQDCTVPCAQQVDQTCGQLEDECNAFFAPLCAQEEAPENCAEAIATCCALLGACQARDFLSCFMTVTRGVVVADPR
jgi:hypothetical protein